MCRCLGEMLFVMFVIWKVGVFFAIKKYNSLLFIVKIWVQ